ncbi:MAG: hypothetical protein S4CHLAM81_09120 [Chlamydiales bacterium]|nr:hypothetical protein [Chlamydiales bacterium]MCH9635691.1 hypothetical protein [Chlamydiales bacterium]
MLTAVVGAAILAFGVTALTSINGSATNPMHQLVHKVAVCVGSNPLSMPILVATVGGAFTLAATLGYGHEVRKAPTQ